MKTELEAASTCFPANVHAVSHLFQQQGYLSNLRAFEHAYLVDIFHFPFDALKNGHTLLLSLALQMLGDAPRVDSALPISPLDPHQGNVKQEHARELQSVHSSGEAEYQVGSSSACLCMFYFIFIYLYLSLAST